MFHPTYHFIFESLAYFIGFWIYRRKKKSAPDSWLVVGAILGAALGSKIGFWLHHPTFDPNLPHTFLGGKTILGGFLGGWLGVEIAKWKRGIRTRTGDDFVFPMTIGLVIGRIGCFLSGLHDRTFGLPSSVPWAIDFGDGLPRHPTQIYEILFCLAFLLLTLKRRIQAPGSLFRWWMLSYGIWRFLLDFLKPIPFSYGDLLSGIQILGLLSASISLWQLRNQNDKNPIL